MTKGDATLRAMFPMRFELLTRTTDLSQEFWETFVEKISKRVPPLKKWTLEVVLSPNQIRFYLESEKDFSHYANELLPFVLQQDPQQNAESYPPTTFCYVDFSLKENIIRVKEREMLRKKRDLKGIRWSFSTLPLGSYSKLELYFADEAGKAYRCRRHFVGKAPLHLLAINFSQTLQYKPKTIPLYVQVQKTVELLNADEKGALLEVGGFPYFQKPKYLPLKNYQYERHGLVVGQTGTGKSKYLTHFIRQLEIQGVTDTHTIVVLDPHAMLYTDFGDNAQHCNIDFIRSACQLFAKLGEPALASELTILLFKTLMGDQFNSKVERVLKYTLFALFTGNIMSLENLRIFITDIAERKKLLREIPVLENIRMFFDGEFSELQTKHYSESILPILGLLDELAFLPIANFQEAQSLEELIQNHTQVFLSLNRTMLGQKATKLIAGLLIQQLFLLAQSGRLSKKILFLIDEVSIVQNEALAAILSEARKFGLSLTLSQQYLQQIDKPILQSVLTNVSNYIIFKVSDEDAEILANNLEFSFPEEAFAGAPDRASYEKHLKIKMMTGLHPRECIARIFANDIFYPVIKARTRDS